MSDHVKRTYRSPRRAQTAAQTQRLIRDAAARLFVEQGITATTMRQIAAAAGVAERTVYTAFATKTALFHEVINIAAVGDQLPIPVAERAEFTATQTQPDPVRAAQQFVDHGCALLERAGDLIIAAIESSGADPDMRQFCEHGAAATAANLRTVARAWHHNRLLRDQLDPDQAAAMLYALASPHVHHLLRRHQGWDPDRYRAWLTHTITHTILRTP